MIKPKRSAEQQVADELDHRALKPDFVETDDIGQPSRAGIPFKPQTPPRRKAGARGGGARAEDQGQMTTPRAPFKTRRWTEAEDAALRSLVDAV
jgi:hypothetical protein